MADYFAERWSRVEAFARTGLFDTVEDDGEMLTETELYANAYAKPRLDEDEVADQDWMQMAFTLRYECPDLFIEMLLVESRKRWEDYTAAKEVMLDRTHIPEAPWWIVQAVDKKKARLNCIHHLLQQMPYEEVPHQPIILPARVRHEDYIRQQVPSEMFVPEIY